MLTLGQYLRPSAQHLPVVEYVPPEVFAEYARGRGALGLYVEAAPFVRSSYRAEESSPSGGAGSRVRRGSRRVLVHRGEHQRHDQSHRHCDEGRVTRVRSRIWRAVGRAAGADVIDINLGPARKDGDKMMEFVVETVPR